MRLSRFFLSHSFSGKSGKKFWKIRLGVELDGSFCGMSVDNRGCKTLRLSGKGTDSFIRQIPDRRVGDGDTAITYCPPAQALTSGEFIRDAVFDAAIRPVARVRRA